MKMAILKVGFLLFVLIAEIALAKKQKRPTPRSGYALLRSGDPTVVGAISFVEANGKMHIMGTIANLTDGLHGLHIHESGNTDDQCSKIGDHYNPYDRPHSCDSETGHFGDLGNIESINGLAYVNKTVKGMTLANSNGKEGNQNPGVGGLAIAVDMNPDSCQDEDDGGSAPVISCGRITT